MIFEGILVALCGKVGKDAIDVEHAKSIMLELPEEEKQAFLQDETRRFIHFTSKECAEQIMKFGGLIPTKGVIANHFAQSIDSEGKKKFDEMVFMFDSANFSVEDYIRNLPRDRSPFSGCYEYYAISTRPDKYEVNSFRQRVHDGAITYNGDLSIKGTDTKLVKYVLGLDEQGKYKFDEVAVDFEYEAPQELKDKLAKDKMGILKYTFTTYMSEVEQSKRGLEDFKSKKEIYKEQIRRAKAWAMDRKQFREEQKDKNYIFEKDGRTIVVKNIDYEKIGGKKLQKLAIIENGPDTKKKSVSQATKFCYMDEFNIEDMDSRVATEYFFGNLDRIKDKQSTVPEYIGLPLENLETHEVTNEYDTTFDTTFKEYMDKRQARIDEMQPKYEEYRNSKKITHKIKAMFSKVLGRKKDIKMLGESSEQQAYEVETKESLPINDAKEMTMFSHLHEQTRKSEEVIAYDQSYKEVQSIEGQDLTIEGQ